MQQVAPQDFAIFTDGSAVKKRDFRVNNARYICFSIILIFIICIDTLLTKGIVTLIFFG